MQSRLGVARLHCCHRAVIHTACVAAADLRQLRHSQQWHICNLNAPLRQRPAAPVNCLDDSASIQMARQMYENKKCFS